MKMVYVKSVFEGESEGARTDTVRNGYLLVYSARESAAETLLMIDGYI